MRVSLVWEKDKRPFRKVEKKKEVITSFCKVRFSKTVLGVSHFWNLELTAKGRVYEYL
jgi:hypothetical protein